MVLVFVCFLLCVSVADAQPVENAKNNQTQGVSKKKKKTTPIVMRFNFSIDGEHMGEIVGEKSRSANQEDKLQAEALKNALKQFLPEDKLAELVAAKDNKGFISFSKLTQMGFTTALDLSKMRVNMSIPLKFKKERKKKVGGTSNSELKENVGAAKLSSAVNFRVARSELSGIGTNTAVISPNINLFGLNIESQISGQQNQGKKMSWYRDYFSAVYDFREKGNRLTFGDIFSGGVDYQSVPKLFGAGFNHYVNKKKRGLYSDVSIEILRPSTVKIYVNDILVQTERLFPGTYTYDDISFKYGFNDIRIEIEDDTGRIINLDKSCFRDGGILDLGEYECGLSVGKPEVKTDSGRYSKNYMTAGFLKVGLWNSFEADLGWQRNTVGQLQSYGITFGSFLGVCSFTCARSIQGKHSDGKTTGYAKKIKFSMTPAKLFDVNISFLLSAEKRDRMFIPYEQESDGILKKIAMGNELLGFTILNYSLGLSKSSIGSIKFSKSKKIYTDHTYDTTYTVGFTRNFRMNDSTLFNDASVAIDFSKKESKDGKKEKIISLNSLLKFKNDVSVRGYRENNLIEGTNAYHCGITVPYPKIKSIPLKGSVTKSNSSTSQTYSTTMHYESENLKSDINYSHQKSREKISVSKQAALETNWYFADGHSAMSSKALESSGFVMVIPSKELEKYPISLRGDDQADTGGIVDTVAYDEVRSFNVKTPDMPLGMKIENSSFNVRGEYKRGSLVQITSNGGSCAVKGVLMYENGTPVASASGYVTYLSEKKTQTPFFTNKKGKFSIIGLKAGEYELSLYGETLVAPVKFTLKQLDKFEYQKIGTKLVKDPPED